MLFSHLSSAYLRNSLLVLLGLCAFWTFQPSTPRQPQSELTSEEKVRLALADTLGAENFQLYLTMESRLVVKTVEANEIGDSAVQSEQVKDEEMGPKPSENKGQYSYHVASRNYLVEETKTREVSTENQVTKIRCVVLVKSGVWERTELARPILESLLGFEKERGDQLSFVQQP